MDFSVGSVKKEGMALIELVIAIAIIVVVGAIVLPNMGRLLPSYTRKQFLSALDTFVHTGWQKAFLSRSIHKIVFDLDKRVISLESATNTVDAQGNVQYVPVKTVPICRIPPIIEIKQFFIEGYDEIARYTGNKNAARVWFFIMPEGACQEVIINMIDTSYSSPAQAASTISLVLNPLTARFDLYDTFQKP